MVTPAPDYKEMQTNPIPVPASPLETPPMTAEQIQPSSLTGIAPNSTGETPSIIPTDDQATAGKIHTIFQMTVEHARILENMWQGLIGLRDALERHIAMTPVLPPPVVSVPETSSAPLPQTNSSEPAIAAAPVIIKEAVQGLEPVTQINNNQIPG